MNDSRNMLSKGIALFLSNTYEYRKLTCELTSYDVLNVMGSSVNGY